MELLFNPDVMIVYGCICLLVCILVIYAKILSNHNPSILEKRVLLFFIITGALTAIPAVLIEIEHYRIQEKKAIQESAKVQCDCEVHRWINGV